MTTLIVLSGTYITSELVAEFGRLPACFIPNGTRRLYQSQLEAWGGEADRVVMTLPEDYEIPPADKSILEGLGCAIFRSDPSSLLHEAIIEVIRQANVAGRIRLLFGDTLVHLRAEQITENIFAVGHSPQLAVWASYERDGNKVRFVNKLEANTSGVVTGFFDLADASMLADSLQTGGSFLAGLNLYAENHTLQPVKADRWLDFGHLFSYHLARRSEFDARSFNQIESDQLSVLKTGIPVRKIFAEAAWYEHLPATMKLYSPQYLGFDKSTKPGYRIEYLYLPILSELFTFGELPVRSWEIILSSCRDFLEACQRHCPSEYDIPLSFGEGFYQDMILGKTVRRVKQFARSHDLSIEREWRYENHVVPSLQVVITELFEMITPTKTEDICFWHGDFHFANIFFDFRSQRIKAIDPRGMMSDGALSLYGDPRYDIAKLGHSIVGHYDRILAGRFELKYEPYSLSIDFDLEECSPIMDYYAGMRAGKYALVNTEILAMISLLFFSMLPLHSNNSRRQLAMLANGYRMFEMARSNR